MFVLRFGVELAVALDVLHYYYFFLFFLNKMFHRYVFLKKTKQNENNVLYVAIYCLCD